MAIVRTSRRLRQEDAAGRRGRALAYLGRGAGDGRAHGPLTPSELAEIERIKRPTATRTLRLLDDAGLVERAPTPRTAAARSSASAPRAASGCAGSAGARTPTWRGGCATFPPRTSRRSSAPPEILERVLEEPRSRPAGTPVSAALRRSVDSLSVPNYRRYFAGQIVSLSGNWMQMVAEIWLVLSLTGSGLAVGMTTALQFLPILLFGAWGGVLADRFAKRRLLMVTQAHGVPAIALFVTAPARRTLDGLRPGLRPRHRQRRRQPDPAGLRDRDGRPRAGRQRGQPQQRPDPLGAPLGPASPG